MSVEIYQFWLIFLFGETIGILDWSRLRNGALRQSHVDRALTASLTDSQK